MKTKRYRLTIDFSLRLKDGEKLDRHTITAFKNQLHNRVYDWDGYFYAYCDNKDGTAYDTDIQPSNVKSKIKLL